MLARLAEKKIVAAIATSASSRSEVDHVEYAADEAR